MRRALLIPDRIDSEPETIDLDSFNKEDYEVLGDLVGGFFDIVRVRDGQGELTVFVNDTGWVQTPQLPLNERASRIVLHRGYTSPLAGPAVILGATSVYTGETEGLSEQLRDALVIECKAAVR